jgi:hypothetical protein
MKTHPTNDATAEWQTALDSIQTAHEESRKMRGILQAIVDTIKTHQDTLAANGISTDF